MWYLFVQENIEQILGGILCQNYFQKWFPNIAQYFENLATELSSLKKGFAFCFIFFLPPFLGGSVISDFLQLGTSRDSWQGVPRDC